MIRYALICDQEDEFEGWFGSSADFDRQQAEGELACPICGSQAVRKAVMAPSVVRTDHSRSAAAQRQAFVRAVREEIRDKFDYVGPSFAKEARAIHEGRAAERPIWGEATAEEAKAMAEDGIAAAPLPPELAPTPPDKLN
jgi:hypothetical protein